ncbi:TIGR04211 family SH3 domain-containing protein [Ectothiorhodospiraceae bacterium 2226]|nr:TIGR04211 family SH3 domain-containing protein [Ectothiorhodospiraceae bacterium 2226]
MARIILIILLLIGAGAAAAAERVQYVSDELTIHLRAGQSTQFRILRMLPSGTQLTVLEAGDSGEYVRVRTRDGLEGWVLTQYLVDQPVARDRLARAERRLAELQESHQRLQATHREVSGERDELRRERDALLSAKNKLDGEFTRLQEVAARPAQLEQDNRELMQRAVLLEKDLDMVRQEKSLLDRRVQQEWFLIGAGVLFGGMVLGLLLPRLRRRRDNLSSW